MSLQIWLPLNKQGDFTNRGVGDLNITSNTSQYNNEGKIGGCVLCSSSQRLTFTCQDWFKLNPSTKFSVALWIKGCTSGSWLFACGSWEIQFRTTTIRFYPGGSGDYYPAYWNTTVDPERWYHICGTWDGCRSCLYVDGDLKCTTEIPETATFYDFASHKQFPIPWGDTRYINDFRLYDHTLSPQEVKEISQGLVLHYKLDDIVNPNLLNPINNNSSDFDYEDGIYSNNRVDGWNYMNLYISHNKNGVNTDFVAAKIINEPGHYTYTFTTTSTTDHLNFAHSGYNVNLRPFNVGSISASPNTTYTFSMDVLSSNPSVIGGLKLARLKLEKGSVETIYTPYSITPDILDKTCYDSSGYNIDGTITGDFTIQSDSPRYDKCVINTENKELLYTPINFPESCGITFNLWTKVSDRGHQFSGMIATSSNSIPTDYYTTALHQYDGCFRLTGTNGSQSILNINTEEIPINQWKMVTITHDGNLVKLYIDGEFIRSGTLASNLVGFNSLFLGWSKAGEVDRYYKGGWSDFRIYSTALSAEDVKDLYKTSAIIDNRGTLHAREIVENTENLFTLEKLLETINPANWNPDSTNPQSNPQWVMRNGQRALAICPHQFYYYSNQDSTGLLSQSHLKKYFKPGKQYKFDFWIDVDDNYYTVDGVLKTSYAGVGLRYTDGNEVYGYITNDLNSPKGFQHKVYYSDPTKTIQGIYFHYNTNTPGYYRSDSSITEVTDVDIQKSGIVEAPWLVDTNALLGTASQYDTNIYEEPDGSRWVRIFHHANPSSTNLFDSTDAFTKHVYKDANRWFDVSVCNQLSSWELMIKQKPSSTDTLQKYRWKQSVNPMVATADDVATDKVIYDTSSGYTSCPYKGLFRLNSNTYLSQGDYWFGAIGCWTSYNSGIPGWNQQTISETGFMDLYVRIDDTFKKETNIYDNKIECNSIVEF